MEGGAGSLHRNFSEIDWSLESIGNQRGLPKRGHGYW